MIHSARPTVSPVANIVFALFFFFARFYKVYRQMTCTKTMIPTRCDCGLAWWIKINTDQDCVLAKYIIDDLWLVFL